MHVIDSNILERDAGGKPLHTFPHPALGCGAARHLGGRSARCHGMTQGAISRASAACAGQQERFDVVSPRVDLLTLRLFVAIVEERSLAKAADRYNIANSAVSKRISF